MRRFKKIFGQMSSVSSSPSESEGRSSPERDSVSRGSSVSTGLREEYEDLLRYAVVTPILDRKVPAKQTPLLRPQSPAPDATRGAPLQPEISKVQSDESQSSHPPPGYQPPFSSTNLPRPQSVPAPRGHHSAANGYGDDITEESHDQSGDIVSGSHDHSHDSEEGLQKLPTVDPEMVRLGTQLDAWCLDLKRNVLAEFEQSRIRLMERHHVELQKERQRHGYELRQVQEELERCKELAVTYEQTIARKDHIIASLTRGLQKQKEKVELQRSFSAWKLRHTEDKRELFTTALARQHHGRKLRSRVLAAWHGIIQGRWKQRAERACQSRAEEVCVQLTNEYEERLAAVQRSLDESRQEAARLRTERDLYEENMKKAFMRGVCALNLEAMSMFRAHDGPQGTGYHSDGDALDPAAQDGVPAPVSNGSGAAQNLEPVPGHSHTGGNHADLIPYGAHTSAEVPPKTIHLTCVATEGSGGANPTPWAAPRPRSGPQKAACLPPGTCRGHMRHVAGASRQSRESKAGRGPSVTIERHAQ